MSNNLASTFSCWTDNGQPGVTLSQGDAVGMLGTCEQCTQAILRGPATDGSFVTTPDQKNWQIVGGAPVFVDDWAPFGGPQPTTLRSRICPPSGRFRPTARC